MKKVFTLLITCFLFFKSQALNGDCKTATGADPPKVRKTDGNMISDPPFITADKDKNSLCGGGSMKLTASKGNGVYDWYYEGVLIDNNTTDQRTIYKAGKYTVISDGIPSNALVVKLFKDTGKPTITFIE